MQRKRDRKLAEQIASEIDYKKRLRDNESSMV